MSPKPVESITLPRTLYSLLFVVLFSLFYGRESAAHRLQPGVLTLKEIAPNRFTVRWLPPDNGHSQGPPVAVHFPKQCRLSGGETLQAQGGVPGLDVLDCTASGLSGPVSFSSPGNVIGPVGVDIDWLTGDDWFRVTSAEPPVLELPGRGSDGGGLEVAGDFVVLGIHHILSGVDHILFVLGLLLLVKTRKRLLWTVTSFTVAHSITLTAAALHLVHLPAGPVEICIALSILLLAAETSTSGDTITRRAPWLIAFSFGLLHGFGFAAALSSAEVPSSHLPLALFSFNVGVELGQLMTIGAAALIWTRIPKRLKQDGGVERFASFVLGGFATYWLLQRIQYWLSSLM